MTKHLSYRSNYVSFCPVNFLSIEIFLGAVAFRVLKYFALQGPFCKAGQTWIRKKLYCVTCKEFFKIRFTFKSVLHLIYYLRGYGLNILF